MKIHLLALSFLLIISCKNDMETSNIVFLHHSTGGRIWRGDVNKYFYKVFKRSAVEKWINHYNRKNKIRLDITQMTFPKQQPYGWKNYPFDYYNIWVKHGGDKPFMTEPTLEMLVQDYDIIIWKHCFPVSNVQQDTLQADIDSEIKTVSNYKLQYEALKNKMHQFPDKKFILWTPAPLVQSKTNEEEGRRIKDFYEWVVNVWDERNDNIFLWDYYKLATRNGLFLDQEYADGIDNSHPNRKFSGNISRYFANRIVQVAKGVADNQPITGVEL